jgi:predicted MFS family arabinose efflux permease
MACSWGTEYIGYVLLCYGLFDAAGSYSFGYIIKYVGRVPIFLFAAAIHLTLFVLFFHWMPTGKNNYVLFICAGLVRLMPFGRRRSTVRTVLKYNKKNYSAVHHQRIKKGSLSRVNLWLLP